jgi:hypothetical protein
LKIVYNIDKEDKMSIVYKIEWDMDDVYSVFHIDENKNKVIDYQGLICECESFIRLHELGYFSY